MRQKDFKMFPGMGERLRVVSIVGEVRDVLTQLWVVIM